MKINKIIIEGPDCSGKSTVVERIKNSLRWDSKSLHHIEGNQFDRYLKEYAFAERVVFDRAHFSEEVYSILWRDGNPFSEKEKQILDSLACYRALIIFMCPDLEIMKERYRKRNFQQQIKLEELQKSRELFLERLANIPHLLYESKDYAELDKLLERVLEMTK